MLFYCIWNEQSVQYFAMQKRQYLKRSQSQEIVQECCICQLTLRETPPIVMLPQTILKRKHFDKPLKLSQSVLIEELATKGRSNHLRVVYREALQQNKLLEMLQSYHNFSSIVTHIKPLILQRVEKDRGHPIHFFGKPFYLLRDRNKSQKLLSLGRLKRNRCELKNGSGASTDEEKYPTNQKFKDLGQKHRSPYKQSENVSLRRLTRNLSNMISKFKENFYINPSVVFQLMDFVPGHVLDVTKLEKQQVFKKQLDNISIIKEKTVERLHTFDVPYENIDNTYGLPARGKIAHSRNLNLIKDSKSTKKLPKKCGLAGIKENISPNQRIHTDYDLEIIGKDKKKSISSKKLDRFKSPGLEGVSKGKSSNKKVSVSKSRLSRKL